jgi:hypothetical protein
VRRISEYRDSVKDGRFTRVIGFRPTGWEFEGKKKGERDLIHLLFGDKAHDITVYGKRSLSVGFK